MWVKCRESHKLRLCFHWGWTGRYRGPGAPRLYANVIAVFSLLTVQPHLGKYVERLFCVGSFLADLLFPDIFEAKEV